jgi:lysophospholipase L1-like esterase
MYRFQIRAQTQVGESIVLTGSSIKLGAWDLTKAIPLKTSADRYPLWWTDSEIDLHADAQTIEYQYVRLIPGQDPHWESWGHNRWVSIDPNHHSRTIVVEDGEFGHIQPYSFGYFEKPLESTTLDRPTHPDGLKIVVIGSSVALGHNAWLVQGWANELGQRLQEKYGHHLINLSKVGANVSSTIDRFPTVVAPENPDVVIIALSLGNEGFTHCPPHDRRALQRRFESGLQQLVKMTRQLGARPILGGLYPNGHYTPEHDWLLQDTHRRMLTWGVPILDWLAVLNDGQGRWRSGLAFDPAHPNTYGHQLMAQAIDLSLFDVTKSELVAETQRLNQTLEIPIYQDGNQFQIAAHIQEKQLRLTNLSDYPYTIAPHCQDLQTALQNDAKLIPGLYLIQQPQPGVLPFFAVESDGTIETTLTLPPHTDLEYTSAFNLFSPNSSKVLFYDGHLGILQADEQNLWMINESDHVFNVHPMWREVRNVLKALPQGIYEDPLYPDIRFRTLMIGDHGLESRVKIPAKSAVSFQFRCPLSDIRRVAVLPLGDRCAVRMLLHKLDYDGPAFPFDLTRTTNIADIADIIDNGFYDMWNPALLSYSAEAGRIYHGKWSGLSFAHEVEDHEDPQNDMTPIFDRMRSRYSARAERFGYTIEHCDQVLFVRTGIADRGGAINLVQKLEKQCQGKPFQLLLLSPQSSDEFAGLDQVVHYNVEFNPDHMCADDGHWMYCTKIMGGILDDLGISSKNLFWCPPTTPKK